MKVVRAATAGFCMGVSLALQRLDKALEEQPARPTRTLGPIIHNPQVLADYEQRGVFCIEGAEDVREGDRVVIRAHGIPRELEEAVRSRGAVVVDATCPKVKKAQLAIARATKNGRRCCCSARRRTLKCAGWFPMPAGKRMFSGTKPLLRRCIPIPRCRTCWHRRRPSIAGLLSILKRNCGNGCRIWRCFPPFATPRASVRTRRAALPPKLTQWWSWAAETAATRAVWPSWPRKAAFPPGMWKAPPNCCEKIFMKNRPWA